MVDEVSIKVVADAKQAEKSLKNIDYWLKALGEDTELLKDLQTEYKEALAESGGRKTEKVRNAYTKVLRLQSAVVRDKREIEKLDRRDAKNLKQSEKSVTNMSKAFKVIGRFVSAGAIIGGINKAIGIAEEGRENLYMAQRAGLSGGTYESVTSGFSALGINPKEIGGLLVDLRETAVGLKSGLNFNERTIAGLARFGIRADKSPEQILYDLADVAKANKENASVRLAFRQFFGISEATFDKLSKGSDEIRRMVENATEELGSMSTSMLEGMRETSEAWSRATTVFENAVKSLTTGAVGEFLRNVAYWVEKIALSILGNPEAEKRLKEKEDELLFLKENAKYVRMLSEEDKRKYIRSRQNMTEEELFMITGKKSNIEDYIAAKRLAALVQYSADYETDKARRAEFIRQKETYLKEAEEILRRDSLKNGWIEKYGSDLVATNMRPINTKLEYGDVDMSDDTDPEQPIIPKGYGGRVFVDVASKSGVEKFILAKEKAAVKTNTKNSTYGEPRIYDLDDEEPIMPSGYKGGRGRIILDKQAEQKLEKLVVPEKMSSLIGGAGFGNQVNVLIENFSQSLNGGNNLENVGSVAYNGVYDALDDSAVELVKSL